MYMLYNMSRAYIKHQRDVYALSALYLIYIPANLFEVCLKHDINCIIHCTMYRGCLTI